jgi:hypothetical protein
VLYNISSRCVIVGLSKSSGSHLTELGVIKISLRASISFSCTLYFSLFRLDSASGDFSLKSSWIQYKVVLKLILNLVLKTDSFLEMLTRCAT